MGVIQGVMLFARNFVAGDPWIILDPFGNDFHHPFLVFLVALGMVGMAGVPPQTSLR